VLQGVIEKLIEMGRCYGMEMKVGRNEDDYNLNATTPIYRGADKSLARPGRKQSNVFVTMA